MAVPLKNAVGTFSPQGFSNFFKFSAVNRSLGFGISTAFVSLFSSQINEEGKTFQNKKIFYSWKVFRSFDPICANIHTYIHTYIYTTPVADSQSSAGGMGMSANRCDE